MRALLFAALVLVLLGAGYLGASGTIDDVRFLRELPRATLAAPRAGPAIYRAKVFGPADRQSPSGKPAAMWWWSVVTGGSKSRKTTCSYREIDRLELRGDGVAVPVPALTNASALSLLQGSRVDWDQRLVVDLGDLPNIDTSTLPRHAARCGGTNPNYVERWLPSGADVEVVGCFKDGALHACEARLRAVVSAPVLMVHRVRRADHAYTAFVVVCAFSTILVGALFILSLRELKRTLQSVRPGKSS